MKPNLPIQLWMLLQELTYIKWDKVRFLRNYETNCLGQMCMSNMNISPTTCQNNISLVV